MKFAHELTSYHSFLDESISPILVLDIYVASYVPGGLEFVVIFIMLLALFTG